MIRSHDLRHLHLGCGESLRSRLLTAVFPAGTGERRPRSGQRPTTKPNGRVRG